MGQRRLIPDRDDQPKRMLNRLGLSLFVIMLLLIGSSTALATGTFSDDDGNTHEANIEAIAAAGITKGCNPPANTRYCPSRDVSRGEMAAFLVRALGYSAGGGEDLFVDDDGSIFEVDIDRLGTAGVTKGCNPPNNDRFCPNDAVARDAMASFLARALGLDPIPPVSKQAYLFGPHVGGAGEWGILDDKFTGAHFTPTTPDKAIPILEAAQSEGKSVILLLARSGSKYQNDDYTFSMVKWKAAIDQYASMDFSPYIEDGTFLAHYLVSEPMAKNSWGGKVITAPELDEMARYSRQYWPNLTTVVREHPTDLIAHAGGKGVPLPNWSWTYLDAAWARYSADKGGINQFIAEEVAAAKKQDLGLLFGMNVLDGGSGGGNMTFEELLDFGPKLIAEPYGCAMLMWHYRQDGGDAYFARSDVDSAMAEMAKQARDRPAGNCRSH